MSYNDDCSYKVFVGSIDFNASEQEVTEAFQPFGEITNTVILRDKETNKSRGFGFITFKEKKSVEDAIQGMNNKLIRGRPIVVNYAEKKSASAGSKPPTSYGGAPGGQSQSYYGQQQQQQQQNYYQGQAGYGGWNQQGYGWQQQGQPYWPQYGQWNQQAQQWGQQSSGNQGSGNGYPQNQQYSSSNMSYNGSGGY